MWLTNRKRLVSILEKLSVAEPHQAAPVHEALEIARGLVPFESSSGSCSWFNCYGGGTLSDKWLVSESSNYTQLLCSDHRSASVSLIWHSPETVTQLAMFGRDLGIKAPSNFRISEPSQQ